MPEVDRVIGNTEKMQPETWAGMGRRFRGGHGKGAGRRHHVSDRDRGPPDRRLRHALARLCAGSERLRSPLHLLHHSLWPGELAVRAPPVSWWTRSRRLVGARLQRGGADRRRPDKLGRRSTRRAAAGRPGDAHPAAWCPTCRACRISSIDSIEADENLMQAIATRAAADVRICTCRSRHWRRPDPQADEAPSTFARTTPLPFCEEARRPAARHGLRRGYHRGLSDRRPRRPSAIR